MNVKNLKDFPFIICPICNKKYDIFNNAIPIPMNNIRFNNEKKKFETTISVSDGEEDMVDTTILSCNKCFSETPLSFDILELTTKN